MFPETLSRWHPSIDTEAEAIQSSPRFFLVSIQAAGYHWLVAAAQPERVCYFDQYEEQTGWQEIVRKPSPRNEGQHKVRVLVKPAQSPDGSQSIALCWSEGRTEKDRAIRQKQEIRFLADIEKLGKRIAVGRLRTAAKIYEAIGRLKVALSARGSLTAFPTDGNIYV